MLENMVLLTRLIALGVLLASGLLAQLALRWHFEAPGPLPRVELAQPLAEFPAVLGGDWQGVDRPIDEESRYADDHLERQYYHRQSGQSLALWMVYARNGLDRGHHPEVCMAVAGKPEDETARQTCPVDGPGGPVQQYRFGRGTDRQWVFYWHYTLEPPPNENLSNLQHLYQRFRRRPSSVSIEVFAPENAAEDTERARDFVRLVDRAVRDIVGPTALRGSERLPVTLVEPDRVPAMAD